MIRVRVSLALGLKLGNDDVIADDDNVSICFMCLERGDRWRPGRN